MSELAPGAVRRSSWLPASRAQRLAAALGLAILLGLLATYVLALVGGTVTPRRTDFITYFSGASMVLHGKGGTLYDFSSLARTERGVVHPYTLRYGVLPYVYPPYVAVAMAPLAWLTVEAAYAVWVLLSVGTLLACLLALWRNTRLTPPESAAYWMAAAAFIPAFVGLSQGQTSALLLGLLTGAYFALRIRRDTLAGILIALAMVKPPYVLPILLLLLLERRWRALAAAVGAGVVLAVLPTLLLGPGVDIGYLHVARLAAGWHGKFGYEPYFSSSFPGLARSLLPDPASTLFAAVLDLAALAGLVVAAIRKAPLELTFALAVIVGLLISPHVLLHDLTLLFLPAGIALAWRNSWPQLYLFIAAAYALVLAGFVLASGIHLELAVFAMIALGWWLSGAASITRSEVRDS